MYMTVPASNHIMWEQNFEWKISIEEKMAFNLAPEKENILLTPVQPKRCQKKKKSKIDAVVAPSRFQKHLHIKCSNIWQ